MAKPTSAAEPRPKVMAVEGKIEPRMTRMKLRHELLPSVPSVKSAVKNLRGLAGTQS